MTPEQADKLNQILLRVVAIEEHCKPCQELLAAHGTILDGAVGDGGNPGLRTRMMLVEEGHKDLKKAQAGSIRWMRGQIALVLAGLLGIVAKWIVRG